MHATRWTLWLAAVSIALGLIACDSNTSPDGSEPWIQVWMRSGGLFGDFAYDGFTWDGQEDLSILDEDCRIVVIPKADLTRVIAREAATLCGTAAHRQLEVQHSGGIITGVPPSPISQIRGRDRETGEEFSLSIRLLGRVEYFR